MVNGIMNTRLCRVSASVLETKPVLRDDNYIQVDSGTLGQGLHRAEINVTHDEVDDISILGDIRWLNQ